MTDAGAERRRGRALIERAGVAMLMNIDERGTHAGRPMLPLLVPNLVIKQCSKTTRDPLSCHCLLVTAVSCGEFVPQYQGVPGSPPSSEVVVR